MNKNFQNILIVRTDRIGDVVLSLPLTTIIKNKYPNAEISFLLRDYTKDLLYKHPAVDKVLVLEEKKGKVIFWKNIKKIKAENFDTCLILYPTFKISLMLFLSKIKNRIGTGYRWYSFLFNQKIYEHRKYGEKHELEYNLNMLGKMGIDPEQARANVSFDIQIDKNSKQKVDSVLKRFSYKDSLPMVIIHPGSGGSAIDLPVSKIKSLTERLAHELNINLIITGSKNEINICTEISNSNSEIINLAGKLDLRELIALINKTEILIANSTGPIHIAGALNKFVVGFYPLIPSCSPTRWAPFTDKKRIFTPDLDCGGNCTREKCEKLNCMNSIDINKVFKEVDKILNSDNYLEN